MTRPSTSPVFTIGHSTRSLQEFIKLLQESRVTHVVDVRRLPGSARHPQFNEDALAEALAGEGIGFGRSAGLTGRRRVSKTVPFEVNAWWQNRSFHNYADHALSEEFRAALAELREQGRAARVAIMCAEAVWWRCHRRIIADHLLAGGDAVQHITGLGQVVDAELSDGAVAEGDRVVYPRLG